MKCNYYRLIEFNDWIIFKKEDLGERRIALLQVVHEFPDLTIKLIADKIGSSIRSVERDIAFLKFSGILERLGSDKDGSYKIYHRR